MSDAPDDPLPESLLAEGAAMLAAVVADFAAIDGCQVRWLRDPRHPRPLAGTGLAIAARPGRRGLQTFRELAAAADWTLVIAPEFDGILARWCGAAVRAGGRLLGPPVEFVELAANKQRTAERLVSAGVPAPGGVLIGANENLPPDFPYPAVLKPNDGAGSIELVCVASAAAAQRLPPRNRAFRLERFVPGTPASVAVLCGPGEVAALPPCRQRLSRDGRLRYLGGRVPLAAAVQPSGAADTLNARAHNLALRAIAALPATIGYVGVDLILGDDPAGAGDAVIEINPRLTTSYVGLRRLCRTNLARAMIHAAEGRPTELWIGAGSVTFDAGGTITVCDF